MSIDEVCNAFIISREMGLGHNAKRACSPRTIHLLQWSLNIWRNWLTENGVFEYRQLRRDTMFQFLRWLKEHPTYSESSKQRVLRTLRTMFRWMPSDDECKELKTWENMIPSIAKAPRRDYIPTPREIRRFRSGFDTDRFEGLRDYIVTALILDCGVRIGEACSLQLRDVAMDQRVLTVEGKTGRRPVRITNDMARLLTRYLRSRPRTETEQLFVNRCGEPAVPNTFDQSFRKNALRTEVPITPHTLRHAYCTYYLRNGGNIENLRLQTGHTSYDMLRNYLHMAQVGGKQLGDEAERVSPLKLLNTRE